MQAMLPLAHNLPPNESSGASSLSTEWDMMDATPLIDATSLSLFEI